MSFDRHQVLANESKEAATKALSQARWAGLLSNRAPEEEVFLVAILDVRSDCLARRIDKCFKENSLYTESLKICESGATGGRKPHLEKIQVNKLHTQK